MSNPTVGLPELRTPRAAAVAGIIFAAILTAVIYLTRSAALSVGADPLVWLTSQSGRTRVTWALNLVPYAGIAFLWFIGVIRTRLGAAEDKLFATVFLGSGLVFVAMLFASAAALVTAIQLSSPGVPMSVEAVRMLAVLASVLSNVFATRMAAVFMLVVTTAGRRANLLPKWLVVLGYLIPLVLLVSPASARWSPLLFPVWVLSLSIHILVVSRREPRPDEDDWAAVPQ